MRLTYENFAAIQDQETGKFFMGWTMLHRAWMGDIPQIYHQDSYFTLDPTKAVMSHEVTHLVNAFCSQARPDSQYVDGQAFIPMPSSLELVSYDRHSGAIKVYPGKLIKEMRSRTLLSKYPYEVCEFYHNIARKKGGIQDFDTIQVASKPHTYYGMLVGERHEFLANLRSMKRSEFKYQKVRDKLMVVMKNSERSILSTLSYHGPLTIETYNVGEMNDVILRETYSRAY